jgi:hypothetical protein
LRGDDNGFKMNHQTSHRIRGDGRALAITADEKVLLLTVWSYQNGANCGYLAALR